MPKRTKEEAEATRRALLDAALAIFKRDGYQGASLAEIAEKAGVTRGAIYHHFDGKAGLYKALMQRFSGEFDRMVAGAIEAGGSFLEICHRVMVEPLAAIEGNEPYAAFYEIANFRTISIPELAEIHQENIAGSMAMMDQIAGFFRMGVGSGALRLDLDSEHTAHAFVATQNGLVHLWMLSGRAFSLRGAAEEAAVIFVRGIQAD